MAKLDLRKVHVYRRVDLPDGRTEERLVESHPALHLTNGEGEIFIQDGATFSAGGDEIRVKDLPPWFFEEVGKCSPECLKEHGYKIPHRTNGASKSAPLNVG